MRESWGCYPYDVLDVGERVEITIAVDSVGAVGAHRRVSGRHGQDLKRIINRACHLDAEGALALKTDVTVRGFLDPDTVQRVVFFGRD